jgi:Fe-S oxidoreductase
MSVMFGRTNTNSVQLLNRAGCDVITPREQVCCGALYAHSGQLEKARECARRNIAAFEKFELDAIIINAAGCGSTLKEYHQLLRSDPVWQERALAFSSKVKDLTEWLAGKKFRVSSFEFRVKGPDQSANPRRAEEGGRSGRSRDAYRGLARGTRGRGREA